MSGEGPYERSKKATELLIPHFASMVQSADSTGWLPATIWFCDLLSGKDPPIKAILDSKVVPPLVLFLANGDNRELQLEAAKALIFLADGTFPKTPDPIYEALVSLLHSQDFRVLAHACCSLSILSGCITGQVRNLIRNHRLYYEILRLTRYRTLVADALHTIRNMMEGNQEIIDWYIKDGQILNKLGSWLADDRVKVRKEACWIVCYITADDRWRWMPAFCDAGLIESMVKVVLIDELVVMEAAVRAISNATFGATVEQIRLMVDKGCVEALCYLFCSRFPEIFKVCLDGLENILKAGEEMINGAEVVDNPYAKHVEKIHGWTVVANIAHLYDRELYERALNLLVGYGPMSSSERERALSYRLEDSEF